MSTGVLLHQISEKVLVKNITPSCAIIHKVEFLPIHNNYHNSQL